MPTLHKGAGTLVHFVKRGTFAQIKNVTGGLFASTAPAAKMGFDEITRRGTEAGVRIKQRFAELHARKALASAIALKTKK
jgi:hypothetical protein